MSSMITLTARSFADRFGCLIGGPAFAVAVGLPVVPQLGIRGGISFGLAALGWFFFGRLLVTASCVLPLAKLSSLTVARFVCSALVDGLAVYAVWHIDVRCLWGAAVGIVLSEAVFWWWSRVQAA
jgi:hypothetical protein